MFFFRKKSELVSFRVRFVRGMFNLVPKRIPSVNLLYGKRPIQRIEVGRGKHRLEVPLSAVEDLYKSVDTTKQYHNGDYHPLRWKSFLNLKYAGKQSLRLITFKSLHLNANLFCLGSKRTIYIKLRMTPTPQKQQCVS